MVLLSRINTIRLCLFSRKLEDYLNLLCLLTKPWYLNKGLLTKPWYLNKGSLAARNFVFLLYLNKNPILVEYRIKIYFSS